MPWITTNEKNALKWIVGRVRVYRYCGAVVLTPLFSRLPPIYVDFFIPTNF